jgi:hypothetical protein
MLVSGRVVEGRWNACLGRDGYFPKGLIRGYIITVGVRLLRSLRLCFIEKSEVHSKVAHGKEECRDNATNKENP